MTGFSYCSIAKREIPCPLCSADRFVELAHDDRYSMGVRTVRCAACGLIMTNPMPTPEALADFYAHHYRRYYRGSDRPTPRHIRKFQLEKRAAYHAQIMSDTGLLHQGMAILDVGCAEGSLLDALRRSCAPSRLAGVEPSAGYAAYAQSRFGLEVWPSLDQLSDNKYDLIIAVHVLEHLINPVEYLRNLASRLAEHGRVYLDVPDAARYSSLADLHVAHLYHFTERTFAALLEKAGLQVASLTPHEPPRHPPSLRAVAVPHGRGSLSRLAAHEDQAIYERISSIARHTWLFHLRWRALRLLGR